MDDATKSKDQKIVIHRRGDASVVWETTKGLKIFHVTPFGVVGEFEDREDMKVSEIVMLSEITKIEVFSYGEGGAEPTRPPTPMVCSECKGTGLTDAGETRCSVCEGFGFTTKEKL